MTVRLRANRSASDGRESDDGRQRARRLGAWRPCPVQSRGSLVYCGIVAGERSLPVPMSGNFNITRRARRSYETYHRDKRRKGVDRLAILESRNAPRSPQSGLRSFFTALGRLLGRR